MISLHDDSAEPDYEALAARLTTKTGIPWTPTEVKMWAELFLGLAAGPDESRLSLFRPCASLCSPGLRFLRF